MRGSDCEVRSLNPPRYVQAFCEEILDCLLEFVLTKESRIQQSQIHTRFWYKVTYIDYISNE